MLLLLSFSTFLVSMTFALPQDTGTSSQGTCTEVIQPSTEPGLFNVVYDTDPNFVYSTKNCTSTNQKVLPSSNWALLDCLPAISAVCGTTSTGSAVAGSWTWAWHTTQGTTCQAGLWQELAPYTTRGVGTLDSSCCEKNFQAMVDSLKDGGAFEPSSGNRLSINIAPGGFPFTQAAYSGGSLFNANGVQTTARYPSYILQAYGGPLGSVRRRGC